MADSDLLRFHAQSLRDYAALWFDAEARQDEEISEEEAAYHLCEHAAMLFRYTASAANLAGLTGQQPESRRSLVLAVCRYVAGLTLTDAARRLLAEDVLDADQITELEDLIIERDALEEVHSLVGRLAADLIRDGDVDLRRKLAIARSTVAELDDILWDRQDAISVACRALAGLRTQLAISPDERTQWWFGKATAADEVFEKGSILELFGVARPPAEPARPTRDVIPISAFLFVQGEVPVRLAAADESSSPRPTSLNALITELSGIRVLVTRLGSEIYQFVFIDQNSGERSSRLDGHHIRASLGKSESAKSLISSGVAVVRTAGGFDGCRIETADRQPIGALVLDTDNR